MLQYKPLERAAWATGYSMEGSDWVPVDKDGKKTDVKGKDWANKQYRYGVINGCEGMQGIYGKEFPP